MSEGARGDTGEGARHGATAPRRAPSLGSSGRIPIRLKLVAVLFLPMTLLVALAALRVFDAQREAREARAEAQMAKVVTGPGSLLDRLIAERNYSAVYLLGAADLFSQVEADQYLEGREEVDAAREEFESFVTRQDEQIQDIYAPALEALSGLREMRSAVDADEGPQDFQNVGAMQDMFGRFEQIINPMFEANQRVSLLVTDPTLQRLTRVVDQSLRQSNNLAVLTYELAVAAIAGDASGIDTPEEYMAISMRLRDMQAGEQIIHLNAEGDLRNAVDAVYDSQNNIRTFLDLVVDALESGAPDVGGVFRAAQGDGESPNFGNLRSVAEDELEAAVDEMNSEARQTRWLFLTVGAFLLLVMALVTSLVALSITRPLRQLTRNAMDMAHERLPSAVQGILEAPPGKDVDVPQLEPIEIRTRDEVADVAHALSTVQDSALELAAEQAALRRNIADSFVNLGRRNQALLGRQLDFITELEHNEANPEALANLFRLDHLATRMRRNAESLLVLAGIEPPRRWTAPVRLTDVIRASLGEVEDYQRVTLQGVESATVVGAVAADLAHLLAELIENALTFSPPDQPVEVRGRYTPVLPSIIAPEELRQDHGVYTITITDFGVGMREEDIATANRRLASRESFTVAPSKFLGHYVAGMIAARHGIEVKLHSSPKRGLTATVGLSPNLLSSQEAEAVKAPATASPAGPGVPLRPTTLTRALANQVGTAAQAPTFRPVSGGGQAPGVPVGSASPGDQFVGGPFQPGQEDGSDVHGKRAAVDSYRIGSTEFQIDRGTFTAAEPGAQAPGDYAQLIQRVQGAQMPTTEPVRVRRSETSPQAGGQAQGTGGAGEQALRPRPSQARPQLQLPAGRPSGGEGGDERRARHVQSFLSSFSAGLEQGRDAAARGDHGRQGTDERADDDGAASERDGTGATGAAGER